jgi:hypothetical protein
LCSQAKGQGPLNPHMFQLYFSYWIFSRSSFIFSWDFLMLVAWVRGTGGNLFLLCSSVACKLTIEGSLNKCNSVGSCRCQRVCVTEQTSLQIPDHFPDWSSFLFIFVIVKELFQYLGGEDSILLLWKIQILVVKVSWC